MATYQSPLTVIIKGALAGAAGTWAMGKAMEVGPQLLSRVGVELPEGPKGPTAPDTPTEALAERAAEGVAQQPLTEEQKAIAANVVHWGYGAGWGALYAILQSSFKLPHLFHGALFGGLVGVVADTVMPAMKLQNWPSERPPILTATYLGYHVIFGWGVAVAYAVLNLGRRG